MSQLLESSASSEPTPPGTADPVPANRNEDPAVVTDEPPTKPADPLDELQKRPHPFTD